MIPVADSHLHIGSLERIPELLRYRDLLGLSRVGALSLPLAGVAESEPAGGINFNCAVLAAMTAGAGGVLGYGSLDNRALLTPGVRDSHWNPVEQVQALADAGFFGLKLWEGKPDLQARLGIALDDPRLVAAYRVAGEHGMPVIVHVADPPEFWQRRGGPWSYLGRSVPSFEELMRQAAAICEAAPRTRFIFPHLLFLAGDLPRLSGFLRAYPLALVDLAPGNYLYPALGTPDRRNDARAFFHEFQDRVLLGSDAFFLPENLAALPGTPLTDNLERLLRLQRFLSTDLAVVSPYPLGADATPLVHGLGLSEEVLRPVYAGTLERLVTARGFSAPSGQGAERYLSWWEHRCGDAPGARELVVATRLCIQGYAP